MKKIILIGVILLTSCKTLFTNKTPLKPQIKKVFNEGIVFADNEFDGARLNGLKKVNDSTYQVYIKPENTPINKSPWYSFRIWSKEPTKILLEFVYPKEYKHRYIPKSSFDGMEWMPFEKKDYDIDTLNKKLKLDLMLGPKKRWISAQEIYNSKFIWNWIDSLSQKDFINQEVVGKSVYGKPIKLLRIKKQTAKNAVVFIGRQHPPEIPGGTIALMSFVQTILADTEVAKKFREKFEVLVFPLLNPDGVDNGNWRHNANGKDLNRDWISFAQPESKSVRDWLINSREKGVTSEYRFGIDFHTSRSTYLLVLDSIPKKVKPNVTNQWIKNIKLLRNEKLDIRPRSQSLPYCYNWMINQFGMEAVTYEDGDEVDRNVVRKRAEDYATELMKVLNDKFE